MTLEFSIVKQIEALAYPVAMQRFQSYSSWDNVATFAQCSLDNLHIVGNEDYYAIFAFLPDSKATCVDVAKKSSLAGFPWCDIMVPLRANHISEIKMKLRTKEYNALTFLAARVHYTILSDIVVSWGGEDVHEVVFKMDL